MVTAGALVAITIGVFLSLIYFVTRMGTRTIRKRISGANLHSNVFRSADEYTILEREGDAIQILEVEGSLFFGTADYLEKKIETTCSNGAHVIILDSDAVAEIDLTGAHLLMSGAEFCKKNNAQVLICHYPNGAVARSLDEFGIYEALGLGFVLTTSRDDALAFAEGHFTFEPSLPRPLFKRDFS